MPGEPDAVPAWPNDTPDIFAPTTNAERTTAESDLAIGSRRARTAAQHELANIERELLGLEPGAAYPSLTEDDQVRMLLLGIELQDRMANRLGLARAAPPAKHAGGRPAGTFKRPPPTRRHLQDSYAEASQFGRVSQNDLATTYDTDRTTLRRWLDRAGLPWPPWKHPQQWVPGA